MRCGLSLICKPVNKFWNDILITSKNWKIHVKIAWKLVMLTVFFEYCGDRFLWVLWCYSLKISSSGPNNQQTIYLGNVRHLRENVCQKRTDLWTNNFWILQHNDTPSHTSTLASTIFVRCGFIWRRFWVYWSCKTNFVEGGKGHTGKSL